MNAKPDFLFELGTEELPPTALRMLSESLGKNVRIGLDKAGLHRGEIKIYATPRRLAVLVQELASRQADRRVERRGPALSAAIDKKNGLPTPQARGFARSCGVEVEQLEHLITDKGAWLVFRSIEQGRATRELLPGIITQALAELPIPKRMRWGALKVEFVRPVHWVIMLLGDEIIDTEILGKRTSRETRGHRFHYPAPITIFHPGDYADILKTQGFVLADFAMRRAQIRDQVETAACSVGGRAILDESLLDEVTSLVEWPIPVTGNFESRFLDVPREALISTMKGKQKYFPVEDISGNLLPYFITLSNIDSRDLACVQKGNERVIRPRLADAAFFWEQDRRRSLVERVDGLKGMLFQERLGTLYDKMLRIEQLSLYIANQIGSSPENTKRAALLAKCDLLTDMVGEFPELQGVIGRYYARHDGESLEVATALEEQYLPRCAGDVLPLTPTGQALAIADRLDTLVGIFGIGTPPTGDKDPFGLRRAALGTLRILIEGHLNLDLVSLLKQATAIFEQTPGHPFTQTNVVDQVYDFMMERLRAYFLEQGLQSDEFEAVAARKPIHPLDFQVRIHAVHTFRMLPEAVSLVAANKRIKNILCQFQETIPTTVENSLLTETAEQLLTIRFHSINKEILPLWEARDYQGALTKLAGLKGDVDRFFDEVMVMADDEAVRKNRLSLLKGISNLFLRVADISLLVI
ncbi:glycine--tRNA ligase subunit beta [Gammaproteobacteria bacterium]